MSDDIERARAKRKSMVGTGHVCMHYPAGQYVFVDDGDHWKRVQPATAKAKKLKVIECSLCKKAAVQLDHLYPYYSNNNLCQRHLDMSDQELATERRMAVLAAEGGSE